MLSASKCLLPVIAVSGYSYRDKGPSLAIQLIGLSHQLVTQCKEKESAE